MKKQRNREREKEPDINQNWLSSLRYRIKIHKYYIKTESGQIEKEREIRHRNVRQYVISLPFWGRFLTSERILFSRSRTTISYVRPQDVLINRREKFLNSTMRGWGSFFVMFSVIIHNSFTWMLKNNNWSTNDVKIRTLEGDLYYLWKSKVSTYLVVFRYRGFVKGTGATIKTFIFPDQHVKGRHSEILKCHNRRGINQSHVW